MNREEAKKTLVFQSKNKHSNSTIPQTVDKIYDDIEKQVCENCRFYENSMCDEVARADYGTPFLVVDSNFGCNKFTPKLDIKP